MESLVEALLQEYLRTRSILPIPNERINNGDLVEFSFNQIALLRYHHEQETLRQLRLGIQRWINEKHGGAPTYEEALRNFHELEIDTDALVRAEFIRQAIEVANVVAVKRSQPQSRREVGNISQNEIPSNQSSAVVLQNGAENQPPVRRTGTRRCRPSHRLMDYLCTSEEGTLKVISSTVRGVRWSSGKGGRKQ